LKAGIVNSLSTREVFLIVNDVPDDRIDGRGNVQAFQNHPRIRRGKHTEDLVCESLAD
jgi:hypothetical protein